MGLVVLSYAKLTPNVELSIRATKLYTKSMQISSRGKLSPPGQMVCDAFGVKSPSMASTSLNNSKFNSSEKKCIR